MEEQKEWNPQVEMFPQCFDAFATKVYQTAVNKGWWQEPREEGTLLALIHSEVSEALEALRHGNPPSEKAAGFTQAEEEMADTVIRIMDLAHHKGWRVGAAIAAKAAYNDTRPFKHGGKAF